MHDLSGGFSPEQLRRYSRHVLLPDVGGRGQARLLAATVALDVGGPAARVAAAYLAAAGVGTLVLTGPDRAIEAADLLFPLVASDLGAPLRATVAARLSALNPDVRVDVRDGHGLVVGDAAGLAEALAIGGEAAARLVHALAVAP